MEDERLTRPEEDGGAKSVTEAQAETQSYDEYNNQKYEYVVGYQKKRREDQEKKKKMPRWLQTVIAWGIGALMIAMWLLAYAWSQALH